jgi:pimeloyl-ACP methyl ester carboxylesterase
VFIGGLDAPTIDRFDWQRPIFEKLGASARVVVFDKRGTGSSDRVQGAPSLEERMDDVRAILDAVDSRSVALFGHVDGGAMAALFAATYPERVFALVLFQAKPRFVWAPDFPWGPRREEYEQETRREADRRGTIEQARDRTKGFFPDADVEQLRENARWRRLTASPGAYVALRRMNMDVDVAPSCPPSTCRRCSFTAPRIPSARATSSPAAIAQLMAERMPDARTLQVDMSALPEAVASSPEVAEFMNDAWAGAAAQREQPARILATVLFTDLVGSTQRAVDLGPQWLDLLREHNAAVRRILARYEGKEIATAGDGFFASGSTGCAGDPLRMLHPRRRAEPGPGRPRTASTRANATSSTANSKGWRSRSAPASPPRRRRERSSSRARSATSSPDPGSRSTRAESAISKGSASGRSTP